ncbi:MAG TPA: alpha-L-arabinofuranosidase C-terminal domain-containing protein [Terracidiphilus sp.]|jgi:alpha-N-arabinofuranosidase|nr:alpha-L-arabinofuranosidase C-terminal domain-containing protein [Terracidiphilus sp.]
MHEKTFAGFAFGSLAALLATVSVAQAPVQLTIHADQPTTTVSPMLYGLMTEEINYAYEGGLYAEMVRNRTFRGDWSGVNYWYLVEKGNAAAKMAEDRTTGPSDALKSSLRLDVETADGSDQAGVLNEGWWGMEVKADTEYKGSLYAKAGAAEMGPVTVSLVANQTGRTLASAKLEGIGTDWKQYTFTLKTGAVAAGAANHLEVTVGHAGTLWLQLASLFPPTYKNTPNGQRIDLMEKLAAMHPQFLRFPGGNYVEGDTIAQRFDWKKTIGPLVDRPGHRSPWNYWSTDGMGLLEFLEWCEDLKMQPVLAVYAGYSLQGAHVNPGADLDPYVQDALDEIEYVSGGADTKWGAERVKDGHAQPFALHYVEIGNEDWFDRSGSYEGRFTQFFKAIKAKYPELKLIATAPVKGVKPDVLDEHYYVRATQNFKSATHYDAGTGQAGTPMWDGGHYDKADRNGPKIFVGEWATREGQPTPNMGAALGDAAWMTGLERNSDVVIMASYAPLLVNVNPGGMQWETDLIGYNAEKSYGSPAYYAQVLFGSHIGDHTMASQAEGAGAKFFYSITGSAAEKKLYLKMVNADSMARVVDIDLAGAKIAPAAKVWTLSGKSTQATNSIDNPTAVIPMESAVAAAAKMRHTVPGYSIEVMEFSWE